MKEKDRMKQLVDSYEQPNEIIRESEVKSVNKQAIKEESERLKTIARVDEMFSDNKGFAKQLPAVMGQGQTVNTFIDKTSTDNSNGNQLFNPNYTYLQPHEALVLCIKRTLESGAPISNLGFYEEINWNLNQLGFPSKSPIDIKTAIVKMCKD